MKHQNTISIVIPTFNRADSIKDVLDCLLNQECREDFNYETIIIDNNSKDKTREYVESYKPKFQGRLSYLFEPKQGKSYALNLGISQAKGEIIAFTDDDCLPENNYLINVYDTFQQYGQEVGIIGGKILPKWSTGSYPIWLNEIFTQPIELNTGIPNAKKSTFEGVLGILDFGDKPFIVDYSQKNHDRRKFFGANIAIRKNILQQFGGFREDKIITEDTEICTRIFRAGIKGIYCPNVIVYHKIQNKNFTPDYYYKWWFKHGINEELKVNYKRKFFHPLGIQIDYILETMSFFIKSFFIKDTFEKIILRCDGFFNLGQMIQIMKENII